MEARLQKWDNSDGIRIPNSLLKSLNLKTNDKVELIETRKLKFIEKVSNDEFEDIINLLNACIEERNV